MRKNQKNENKSERKNRDDFNAVLALCGVSAGEPLRRAVYHRNSPEPRDRFWK